MEFSYLRRRSLVRLNAPSHYKFSRLNQIFSTQLWREIGRLFLLSGLECFLRLNEPQSSYMCKLTVFGIITIPGFMAYGGYTEHKIRNSALISLMLICMNDCIQTISTINMEAKLFCEGDL